jgi:signal transduction histidine kinase
MNQALLQRIWDLAGGVSVRTKIFGIVLGSTMLLSLGFTIQVRYAMLNLLEQESREQGVSVARNLAARATDLILINDLYSLHRLLSETKSNHHDVRYAFIMDRQGTLLAHTFGEGFPLALVDLNSVNPNAYQSTRVIQTEDGIIWDVAVPIFDGEAGIARVGISDQSVRTTLANLTTQLALTMVVILTISLLAATFLTWILTRPILDLVDATHAVAKADFTPRVHRWANDEIGDLAEAFNQMTIELGRMDELRLEREHLRQQLLEGIITAQEEERRRIARELHDSTSQSLTSLMVGLRSLEVVCDKPELHMQVSGLREVVSSTLEDVHNLAVQLRPTILDDLGLAEAIERLVKEWQDRNGISADAMVHVGDQRLPESVETALYRIVQEALTNIARHASATTASVLVERRKRDVVTVIEDDGRGFEVDTLPVDGHLGLLGMRERAELLGGRFVVESSCGLGTSVFVYIPLTSKSFSINGVTS